MSVDVSTARMDANLFIDGTWVRGDDGTVTNIDPGTGETVGSVSMASETQVEAAIEAASRAFPAWSTLAAAERGEVLKRAASIIETRREEAVATILLETGKTEPDARGEIQRTIDTLRWNGEQAPRVISTTYPGLVADSRRTSIPTPLGVVAVIPAWNFPAVLGARKLGAALAAGCTVVFKPALFTPAISRLLVEALAEAGLPAGVVNMVFGKAARISRQLTESPRVKALTFTGSTAVGKQLAAQAAPHLIRTVFELGGHAPVIVAAGTDPQRVVDVTGPAKFGSAGQSCVAPSRYFVHESLYDQVVEKLVEKAASLRLGHGTQSESTMGAVADRGRIDELAKLTEEALSRGARIATGGSAVDRPGFYFQPTVLIDVPVEADIMSEEPFGPIATVTSFRNIDEAVRLANSAPYSFAAYVFTNSLEERDHILANLNASNIGVNQTAPSLPDVPLGGLGNSGYGYEGGHEGILAFCQLRLVSETP
jgi:succinate-semialdehyde dehydrogenase/glutarate-semialdehyde dehydrogenase